MKYESGAPHVCIISIIDEDPNTQIYFLRKVWKSL